MPPRRARRRFSSSRAFRHCSPTAASVQHSEVGLIASAVAAWHFELHRWAGWCLQVRSGPMRAHVLLQPGRKRRPSPGDRSWSLTADAALSLLARRPAHDHHLPSPSPALLPPWTSPTMPCECPQSACCARHMSHRTPAPAPPPPHSDRGYIPDFALVSWGAERCDGTQTDAAAATSDPRPERPAHRLAHQAVALVRRAHCGEARVRALAQEPRDCHQDGAGQRAALRGRHGVYAECARQERQVLVLPVRDGQGDARRGRG
jgi:hypothetical protein